MHAADFTPSTMLNLKALPPEMAGIVTDSLKAGDEKYALRQAHLAGWYQQGSDWKRIAPNVRGKVQVRKAHEQPDGKYLITNVPVFYPNAVKGTTNGANTFSSDDLRRIVANTNAGIEAGGQRPGLVKGHPAPEQKAFGIQMPSFGSGVNFREWEGRPGWVTCDLVDVEPAFASEWMGGRFNGLSAGFVQDAHGLNRRIGHIARLGAESQALSHLPVTEIFSAANVFAFSADPASFSAARLPTTKESRMKSKSMLYAAISAAHAAQEASEPGAEEKVKQAHEEYAATYPEADTSPEPTSPTPGVEGDKLGGLKQNEATVYASANEATLAFAADPANAFAALFSQSTKLAQQVEALTQEKGAASRKADWASKVNALAAKFDFDASEYVEQFSALDGNPVAQGALLKILAKLPARTQSLAKLPTVVSRHTAMDPVASEPLAVFSATAQHTGVGIDLPGNVKFDQLADLLA